jgi:hypothetical protein
MPQQGCHPTPDDFLHHKRFRGSCGGQYPDGRRSTFVEACICPPSGRSRLRRSITRTVPVTRVDLAFGKPQLDLHPGGLGVLEDIRQGFLGRLKGAPRRRIWNRGVFTNWSKPAINWTAR